VLNTDAEISGIAPESVIDDVLSSIPTPVETTATEEAAIAGDGGDEERLS
jgi:hypothetical protein